MLTLRSKTLPLGRGMPSGKGGLGKGTPVFGRGGGLKATAVPSWIQAEIDNVPSTNVPMLEPADDDATMKTAYDSEVKPEVKTEVKSKEVKLDPQVASLQAEVKRLTRGLETVAAENEVMRQAGIRLEADNQLLLTANRNLAQKQGKMKEVATSQIRKQQAEIANLQQTQGQLVEQKDTLARNLAMTQQVSNRELGRLSSEGGQLTVERNKLRQQIATLSQQLDQLTQEAQQSGQDKKGLQKQLEGHKEVIKVLNRELDRNVGEKGELMVDNQRKNYGGRLLLQKYNELAREVKKTRNQMSGAKRRITDESRSLVKKPKKS
jgi:chromosome segregation ATPase